MTKKRKITGSSDVELRTICKRRTDIWAPALRWLNASIYSCGVSFKRSIVASENTHRKPLVFSTASLLKGFVKLHNLSWISDSP